jgi:hypothetical protein
MPKKTSTTPSGPSRSQWKSGAFYKVIKLRTGEFILCILDSDVTSLNAETHLSLIRPVHAVPREDRRTVTEDGTGIIATDFKMKEWIDVSSTKEFTIETSFMLTIGDISARIKYQYQEYLKILDAAEQLLNTQADTLQKDAALTALLLEGSKTGEVAFVDFYKDGIILTEEEDAEEARTLREQQDFLRSLDRTREGGAEGEAREDGETEG